jgi:hypothetical protein
METYRYNLRTRHTLNTLKKCIQNLLNGEEWDLAMNDLLKINTGQHGHAPTSPGNGPEPGNDRTDIHTKNLARDDEHGRSSLVEALRGVRPGASQARWRVPVNM